MHCSSDSAFRFIVILLVIVDLSLAKYLNNGNHHVSSKPKLESLVASELNKQENSTKIEKNGILSKQLEDGSYVLTYYGLMLAGAVARSVSATAVHPLNVIKTMLQKRGGKMPEFKWDVMSRGAGSQFIMSVPHGALSFAVTETTKKQLSEAINKLGLSERIPKNILNPLLDMLSSAISTFICSVISTPQMVVTDRIMAGLYSNFFVAVYKIWSTEGWQGFYLGWLPAIVQKIPSYALTWMFFQQLKQLFLYTYQRHGTNIENTLLGSFAAAGACCIMIPIDTVKTRIVTQGAPQPGVPVVYTSMMQCLHKILREEGVGSLYRALPPRLMSVVPMIGIQFAVYEWMKRQLLRQPKPVPKRQVKEESEATVSPQLACPHVDGPVPEIAPKH